MKIDQPTEDVLCALPVPVWEILASGGKAGRFRIKVREIIRKAIEAEREACAKIAETVRARELAKYDGRNCPYDTIAEEIRDRIRMRPATSNKDWSEL